jgi:hypothetical protein
MPLDEISINSERTWVDLVGCIASIVDAFACLAFLFLPTTPATRVRLYIILFIDPLARILGYSAMYQRLLDAKPIWAELGVLPADFGYRFPHRPKCLARVSSPQLSYAKLFYGNRVGFPIGAICDFHPTVWSGDLRLAYRKQSASSPLARLYDGPAGGPSVHHSGLFCVSPAWPVGDLAVGHCLCDYSVVCESDLVLFAGSQGK